MEIEGKRQEIVKIARRLGLRPADREPRSYRKLIKQHAKLAGCRTAA